MNCLGFDGEDKDKEEEEEEEEEEEYYSVEEEENKLYSMDGIHTHGTFSIASVHSHSPTLDRAEIVSGPGTFFGIYDGHMGSQATEFVSEKIFSNIVGRVLERGPRFSLIFDRTISMMEEEYKEYVRMDNPRGPLSTVGTCCLICLIWKKILYIANLGDSEAVMGRLDKKTKTMMVKPLHPVHSTKKQKILNDYQASHWPSPEDSSSHNKILVWKNMAWKVKGFIPLSGTIGDTYLKFNDFRMKDKSNRFYYSGPRIRKPLLLSKQETCEHRLDEETDRFVIIASHGLWDLISKEQAVKIVHRYPKKGAATRLATVAMKRSVKNSDVSYSDLKKMRKGTRKAFLDDITVMVIFIDRLLEEADSAAKPLYVRSDQHGIKVTNSSGEDPSYFCLLH